MSKHLDTDCGRITISDRVLEDLAGIATTECYGVAGMAAKNIQDGLSAMLGHENLGRGVSVAHSESDGPLDVTVNIVVGYGVNIGQVARNIRKKVRYVLTYCTELPVSRVNVNVQGVKVTALDE
ncbi:MAG: Asp23/Gls24 family envelope stress response protein [Bacillota bacterium]